MQKDCVQKTANLKKSKGDSIYNVRKAKIKYPIPPTKRAAWICSWHRNPVRVFHRIPFFGKHLLTETVLYAAHLRLWVPAAAFRCVPSSCSRSCIWGDHDELPAKNQLLWHIFPWRTDALPIFLATVHPITQKPPTSE